MYSSQILPTDKQRKVDDLLALHGQITAFIHQDKRKNVCHTGVSLSVQLIILGSLGAIIWFFVYHYTTRERLLGESGTSYKFTSGNETCELPAQYADSFRDYNWLWGHPRDSCDEQIRTLPGPYGYGRFSRSPEICSEGLMKLCTDLAYFNTEKLEGGIAGVVLIGLAAIIYFGCAYSALKEGFTRMKSNDSSLPDQYYKVKDINALNQALQENAIDSPVNVYAVMPYKDLQRLLSVIENQIASIRRTASNGYGTMYSAPRPNQSASSSSSSHDAVAPTGAYRV